LKKLITVGLNCQSLEEYLRGFDITLRVLQRSYAITRALYEVSVIFLQTKERENSQFFSESNIAFNRFVKMQ
jgi:hypothetical protein